MKLADGCSKARHTGDCPGLASGRLAKRDKAPGQLPRGVVTTSLMGF